MRTGYWIAVFGAVTAMAAFACSSSDSGTTVIKGAGGSVVGKGGSGQGGSGTGGTAQGGSGQGGGGTGGATGACASGETCEDVSGGAGAPSYACVAADPSTMPACTDGPFGSGCSADLMCAFITSLSESICLTKKGQLPTGAATCDQSTPCAGANEMCVQTSSGNFCVTKGCTAPSCPSGKLDLYASDQTTGEVALCVCANGCTP